MWREGSTGLNAELLVACAVAALLVPVVSYDYTLAVLAGPVGLLLMDVRRTDRQHGGRIALSVATLLFCFGYSSTLFPWNSSQPD